LLIKAFASLRNFGGARITATDFRLRFRNGDHRLRVIMAASSGGLRASTPPILVVSAPLTALRYQVSGMRAAAGRDHR
jgi:hypothetical protein